MPENKSDYLQAQREKALKTGTTTVSLVCSDGIVLTSDRRASMGYFIASKDVPKIFQIDDKIGMTVAGSVGDAQALVRIMQAECKLYRMKHGKAMNPKGAATILSNIMNQYKFFPFYVQLLVAGLDERERGEIYSLDPLGGVTEEKFASTGSGSPMAYGLLEELFDREGAIKDNIRVAIRAVRTAMKRDCASGEDIDVVTITKGGFKRLEKEEIAKLEKEKAA